jgi:hypothetical protein
MILGLNGYGAIIFTAFFVFYLVRLWWHIPSYKDIHAQIAHNLINFPKNFAVYTWKGQEEKNRGAPFLALENWFLGWKLRKHDFRLNNNLAVLLTDLGQIEEAEKHLKICEANIPVDQKERGEEYIRHAQNRLIDLKRQAELVQRKIITQ